MALSKDEILDAIAEMSVMDIVELVEAMEEKFGVSAAAAVAVAAPAAGGDADGAAAAEQTEFDVILTSGDEIEHISTPAAAADSTIPQDGVPAPEVISQDVSPGSRAPSLTILNLVPTASPRTIAAADHVSTPPPVMHPQRPATAPANPYLRLPRMPV